MDKAIHAQTGKPLTVVEYVALEGPKLDSKGQPRNRAQMICPACGQEMHTVGEAGPLRDATWAHNPNPSGPWCPIKDEGRAKYALLTPKTEDPGTGKVLREKVLADWRKHWGLAQTIAPKADIDTFIGFIKHADQTRFWSHVGLPEWHVPYIYLATCDFPPATHPAARAIRPEWLRFMFDSRVRTIEDLWMRTTGEWMLLKLVYRSPGSGEPTQRHFVGWTPVKIDKDFLGRTFPTPNQYQLDRMHQEFKV